jgi:hypothetical protein
LAGFSGLQRPEPRSVIVGTGGSDPMRQPVRRARRVDKSHRPECAHRTGGSHGRITDHLAQPRAGAERRPRQGVDTPSAAKGSIKAGAPKSRGPQMAMGRIEHTLLDEGRSSSPTDLIPSPATPPYHTKLRMFLSKTKGWSPRAQSKGRVVQPGRGEQRGQQHTHYKGRDTPKDTPDRSLADCCQLKC